MWVVSSAVSILKGETCMAQSGQKGKKILVIGSSGLVGGNLLPCASKYSFSIIPSFHSYIPDEYKTAGLQLDMSKPVSIAEGLKASEPYCVVNLSCTTVAACEKDQDNAYKVQVEGVRELARACRALGIRLVHISTDMVYSGNKGTPYMLDDEPDPISVYGRTKLEGEKAVQEAGGDYVIARSALVLGKGVFRKGGFLDWMVERIHKDEELPLFLDQLRTPIVVDDLVEVIFRLVESSFCGILFAAGDEGLNRVEIGRKLLDAMGKPYEVIKPVLIDSVTSSVPLQRDLRMDNSKLKEVVGRESFISIEEYFRKLWDVD
jgi:dTDP-4-dehydrorhamnose reductase